MKKLFFLLAFFVGQKLLIAQSYIPLPYINAKWMTQSTAWNGSFYENYYYSYIFNGDTLINAAIYKKLMCTNIIYSPPYFTQYSGAIKQDTNAQKVYYIPPASSTEYLLYDFSLKIGDTVTSYIDPICANQLILCHNNVFIMDSIYVESEYRTRISLASDCDIGLWIEGIGSDGGLLEAQTFGPASTQLWCFEHNGKVLYPLQDTIYSSCDSVPLSVKEHNVLHRSIANISPNPFSTAATIFLSPSFLKEKLSITIFSLLGEEIFQLELKSSETKIERGNLSCGIYLYKVWDTDNNIKETGKIIIQ